MLYRIVDTDNFGSDYPNEKFIGPLFSDKEDAAKVAEIMNKQGGEYTDRFYKVEDSGYALQPGFEP